MPLPETPGHSQTSLGQSLVGSLLLSPGSWCAQGFVCALQESVSPVLWKFWWFYGGVNGTLLQEGLGHYPGLLHPEALALWQATADLYLCRRHSNTVWLSLCEVSESWCTQGLFEPSECLWQVWGLKSKTILPLLPSCKASSLPLDMGYLQEN